MSENLFEVEFQALEDEPRKCAEGRQKAIINEAGIKKGADSQSMGLNLQMTISEGEFKGQKIYEYVNYKKRDGSINEIGDKTLNKICKQFGMTSKDLNNPNQLLGKIISVTLKPETNDAGYTNPKVTNWGALVSEAPAAAVAGDSIPF